MDACAVKVDKNEIVLVQMLVREQEILRTHLKRRTKKLGTYVISSLTFASVVKKLSTDVRVHVQSIVSKIE